MPAVDSLLEEFVTFKVRRDELDRQIDDIEDKLRQIDGDEVEVKVEVDLDEALSKIKELDDAINAAQRSSSGGGFFDDFRRGFGQSNAALKSIGARIDNIRKLTAAWAARIAVVGGAATAIVGAVTAVGTATAIAAGRGEELKDSMSDTLKSVAAIPGTLLKIAGQLQFVRDLGNAFADSTRSFANNLALATGRFQGEELPIVKQLEKLVESAGDIGPVQRITKEIENLQEQLEKTQLIAERADLRKTINALKELEQTAQEIETEKKLNKIQESFEKLNETSLQKLIREQEELNRVQGRLSADVFEANSRRITQQLEELREKSRNLRIVPDSAFQEQEIRKIQEAIRELKEEAATPTDRLLTDLEEIRKTVEEDIRINVTPELDRTLLTRLVADLVEDFQDAAGITERIESLRSRAAEQTEGLIVAPGFLQAFLARRDLEAEASELQATTNSLIEALTAEVARGNQADLAAINRLIRELTGNTVRLQQIADVDF